MKTINQIQERLNELMATETKTWNLEGDELKKAQAAIRKARIEIKFLKIVKAYLQSSPTEDFCKKELKRIAGLLTTISERFTKATVGKKFATLDEEKTFKKEYEKEYEVKKYKTQVKTLKFILK